MITAIILLACALGSTTVTSSAVWSPRHYNSTQNGTAFNATWNATGRITSNLSTASMIYPIRSPALLHASTDTHLTEHAESSPTASSSYEAFSTPSSVWSFKPLGWLNSALPSQVTTLSSSDLRTAVLPSSVGRVNITLPTPVAPSIHRNANTDIARQSSSSSPRPVAPPYYPNTTYPTNSSTAASRTVTPTAGILSLLNLGLSLPGTKRFPWNHTLTSTQSLRSAAVKPSTSASSRPFDSSGMSDTSRAILSDLAGSTVVTDFDVEPASNSSESLDLLPASNTSKSATPKSSWSSSTSQVLNTPFPSAGPSRLSNFTPTWNYSGPSLIPSNVRLGPVPSAAPFRFSNHTPNWNYSGSSLIPSNARLGPANTGSANTAAYSVSVEPWVTAVELSDERHVSQLELLVAEETPTPGTLQGPGFHALGQWSPGADRFPEPTPLPGPGGLGVLVPEGVPNPRIEVPTPKVAEQHVSAPQLDIPATPGTPEQIAQTERPGASATEGGGRNLLEEVHESQVNLVSPMQSTNAPIPPQGGSNVDPPPISSPEPVQDTNQNSGSGSAQNFGPGLNGLEQSRPNDQAGGDAVNDPVEVSDTGNNPQPGEQPGPNEGASSGLGANLRDILPNQQVSPLGSGAVPPPNNEQPERLNPGEVEVQNSGPAEVTAQSSDVHVPQDSLETQSGVSQNNEEPGASNPEAVGIQGSGSGENIQQPGTSGEGQVESQGTGSAENVAQQEADSGLRVGLDGIGFIPQPQDSPPISGAGTPIPDQVQAQRAGSTGNIEQPGGTTQPQDQTQGAGSVQDAAQPDTLNPGQSDAQGAGAPPEAQQPGTTTQGQSQQSGGSSQEQGTAQGVTATGNNGQPGAITQGQGGGSDPNPLANPGTPGGSTQGQVQGQDAGSIPSTEQPSILNPGQNEGQGAAPVQSTNPNQAQGGSAGATPSPETQPGSDPNGGQDISSPQNSEQPGVTNGEGSVIEGSGLDLPAPPEQVTAFGNGEPANSESIGDSQQRQQDGDPQSPGAALPAPKSVVDANGNTNEGPDLIQPAPSEDITALGNGEAGSSESIGNPQQQQAGDPESPGAAPPAPDAVINDGAVSPTSDSGQPDTPGLDVGLNGLAQGGPRTTQAPGVPDMGIGLNGLAQGGPQTTQAEVPGFGASPVVNDGGATPISDSVQPGLGAGLGAVLGAGQDRTGQGDPQTTQAGVAGLGVGLNGLSQAGPQSIAGIPDVSGAPNEIGQGGPEPTPISDSGATQPEDPINPGLPVNDQGVAVGGTTIVEGGPPVTISGNTVAVSSGVIQVGDDRVPIPQPDGSLQTPSPVAVGGLTFSPIPKVAEASETPPVIVAGQEVQNDDGVVQVGDQTLTPGDTPIDVDGTPVSLGPSALVVGTSILPLPDTGTPLPNPVVGSVGDTPVEAVDGGVLIGSQTLAPGAAATISGIPVALGNSDDLVIGDTTTTFSRAPAPVFDSPLNAFGNLDIEAVNSGVRVGTTTVAPGAAATIDNTPVSLGIDNNLIVGSTTIQLTPSPAAQPDSPTPIATIASQPIIGLPSNSGIRIGTSVLTPGVEATISGTPVIVGSSNDIVIGDSTLTFSPPDTAAANILTIGSETFTENSASQFILGSQTLAPGSSPLIFASTTYSLVPSASAIVVNGVTSPLGPPAPTTGPVVTLGDETITELSNGVAVAGQTLTDGGPAIMISGTPLSFDPTGGIVFGSSTVSMPAHVLSDGGAAATFSGVAVSMDDEGLVVGQSTTVAMDTQGAVITVGGTVLSAGPSGLVIWGPKTSSGIETSRVRPTTTIEVGAQATMEAAAGRVPGGWWAPVVVAVGAAGAVGM